VKKQITQKRANQLKDWDANPMGLKHYAMVAGTPTNYRLLAACFAYAVFYLNDDQNLEVAK